MMNDITIEKNGKTTTLFFPSTWNDLTHDQLLYIAGEWETWKQTVIHYSAALPFIQIQLLFVLGRISRWNIFSSKRKALLSVLPSRKEYIKQGDTDEFADKYEYLPRILKLCDFVLFDHVTLTKNPFPSLKAGKYVLFGPANEMMSMVAQEFVFVDSYFVAWLNNRDAVLLDQLIAMLYRPEGTVDVLSKEYLGDKRAPFNRNAYELWLKDVSRLPYRTKIAIALFYQGCRQNFEVQFPEVFSESEDRGGGVAGWYDVMSDLPAEKFGTLQEREQYPVDTMFTELRKIIVTYRNKQKTP